MDHYSFLKVIKLENHVCKLIINRTDKLNALNAELFDELDHFVSHLDTGLFRVLLIQGAGEKSFVAGADIAELQDLDSKLAEQLSAKGQSVFSKLENLPIPVIAAIQGFALGGGLELALACDLRICSEKARFGLPELKLGLIPGYGGTQRLSGVIGQARALQMVLYADMIDAKVAVDWGLVNHAFSLEEFHQKVDEIVQKIASHAPLAVKAALKATRISFKGANFPEEARIFGTLFDTEDAKEGISAFIEKRSPHFTGN